MKTNKEVHKKLGSICVMAMKLNSIVKKETGVTQSDINILLGDAKIEDEKGRESINHIQGIIKELSENILALGKIKDDK